MNNKIYIVDRNGNQIIVDGVAYIELKGDGFANDYLFYSLNEIINGDLNKIYVAKVNNDNLTIDDAEWENIKMAMRGITHQEQVEGLTYLNMFDEKGEGKVFKTEIPRKIALKLDNLTRLRDVYKIAISNPDSESDTSAVGNQFFDSSLLEDKSEEKSVDNTNTPSAFDGSIKPIETTPTPVVEQPTVQQQQTIAPQVQPVQQADAKAPVVEQIAPAPVQKVPAVEAPPAVTEVPAVQTIQPVENVIAVPSIEQVIPAPQPVVETPAVSTPPVEASQPVQDVTQPVLETIDEIKTIAPTPIPEVIPKSDVKGDDFAIPVSTPIQTPDDDNDIFNQIINELSEIKNQNEEIKESIRKLQNNIANINTNLSQQEITNSQGNYNGMINTNMANTTEDVAAIDITSNGSVIIPSFEQAQQTAQQTASVISTNVLEPTNNVENTIINSVPEPSAQVQTVITQPVDIPSPVIEQPVETVPVTPGNTLEVPVAPPVAQQIVEPVPPVVPEVAQTAPAAPVETATVVPTQESAPAVIEQPTAVAGVPELPQIIPEVPMATQNIIMPNGNPIADLPPVQMPMGVSAGDDSSAVGATVTGFPQ